MTDDDLKKVAELYHDINSTKNVESFLKNCSSFTLASGNRSCSEIPSGLQYRIRETVKSYYNKLKEIQKEL
jgi:hypothetical protein